MYLGFTANVLSVVVKLIKISYAQFGSKCSVDVDISGSNPTKHLAKRICNVFAQS